MARVCSVMVAVLVTLCMATWLAAAPQGEAPVLEFFSRAGCPHCTEAAEFLERLERERPELRIVERRVDEDPNALQTLKERARVAGIVAPGVPAFAVGSAVIVGFESAEVTGPRVRELLEGKVVSREVGATCEPSASAECPPADRGSVETTLLGKVSVSKLGLPLFTVVLGLLDGFNPCAMWVLVFLLSMLASLHDRPRMGLIAGTFVLTSGAVYYAFMAAWLNVFLLLGMSRSLEVTLGGVALAMSLLNIKDFVAFKRGPSLTIPEAAKPGIYARVRSVLRANELPTALIGVVGLAILVNFIELLCTAGFPAMYTAILTQQDLPPWAHYAYLALYNVAYIADDGVMVTLGVVTLSRRKLTERAGRWLKLVSGVVMLALAAMLLVWPEALR